MSTSEIAGLVSNIVAEKGPLRFRQIEAYVVLAGVEVSTYDVQRAIDLLAAEGRLKQTDDFRYATAGAASAR